MKPADRPACLACMHYIRDGGHCVESRDFAEGELHSAHSERAVAPVVATLFNRCGADGRFYAPRFPDHRV